MHNTQCHTFKVRAANKMTTTIRLAITSLYTDEYKIVEYNLIMCNVYSHDYAYSGKFSHGAKFSFCSQIDQDWLQQN